MTFKQFTSALTAAMLLASSLSFAAFAEEPDYNTVYINKHTPVLDGIIDPEYYSSFHIEHLWPQSDEPIYTALGKFSYYRTDDDGYDILNEDHERIYKGYTDYNWDCHASSYYLWDDDNLYIALKISDSDYGCVSDERLIYAMEEEEYSYPILQDAVLVSLSCPALNNKIQNISAERAGRIMTSGVSNTVKENGNLTHYSRPDESNSIFSIKYKNEYKVNSDYFAVSEHEDYYIVEMQLPLNPGIKEQLWRSGCELNFVLTVTDSPESARYLTQFTINEDEGAFEGEGGMFRDFIMLVDESSTSKLKLSDEVNQNDVNLDGEINSKDIVRLMKHIANDSAVKPQDINGDGKLNSKDIVALMKIIAES